VSAVLPAHLGSTAQALVRLVDQGGGLQRVPGPLLPHVTMRHAVQFPIDQRDQFLEGAIVTMSSQMGTVGFPGRAAYCATKHAVEGMTKALAVERAITAGAHPDTVQVVDVEEIPLTYLPSNALRLRVKAVGDLDLTG